MSGSPERAYAPGVDRPADTRFPRPFRGRFRLPSGVSGIARLVQSARKGTAVLLMGMLAFSAYGTLLPAPVRCALPGRVNCLGGILGQPLSTGNSSLTQWFNVTMPDYGFWIINTVDGTNESSSWNVYEGYTVHINATSLKADASVGGSAYHGLGVEINATGKQLLGLSAPVGKWMTGSFVAPMHAYYRQHIWCTIECGNGHSGMQLHNLNIIPSTAFPSAAASATPSTGPAPLNVSLTGSVVGGTAPYTTSWNFGDGSATSSALSTSHTYTLAGNYSATLSVADSGGHQASASTTVHVGSSTPLTASASATPATGTAPFVVNLSGAGGGGAPPYSYRWSLGDGSTAAGASLGHLYSAPGAFAPTLTVTDSIGQSATQSASVTAHAAAGSIGVQATASPANGSAPLAVSFSVTPSTGTAPYSAAWVFGDGATGSGSSISHTFTTAGRYQVAVFLSDASGKAGWAVVPVTVHGGSAAALAATLTEFPSAGSPPLPTTSVVSVSGGSGSYPAPTWTFGDTATGSGFETNHTYTALGSYALTAQVSDSTGGHASASTTVHVAGISLSIALNRTRGDAPFSVAAAASVVGGTGTYQPVSWTWGDGTGSAGAAANHTYPAHVVGTVSINASVRDSGGAVASATAMVVVIPPPTAALQASVTDGHTVPLNDVFQLAVHGGSGNYTARPLWSFGDGTTTRGPTPQNHTYLRFGHYHVTVLTNDSLGGAALASAWVNLSAPGSGLGATTPVWTFTGVANPGQAALVLLGIVAVSGLLLLYRNRTKPAPAPRPTNPPRARPPVPRSRQDP